jgi:serine/threonine protein kinase
VGSPKPPTLEQIAGAFPGYEVQGFLGAGGMGCVYRVRDRATGRVLALKILPRELAADPAFVERFEREARTLERLRHPSIVGIHGFGQSGGYCHLLMEHVDGANLRQALRSGRFTPAQALALIPPLCEALQFAHSQGVLHRDIKPENILLDAEGRVKIADFGIAKILGEAGTSVDEFSLTRTGARLGTPHYMAPEQVERPEDVDHRADIYSLGVVFYELLTGELPLGRFQAPSAKASLDERVDEIVLRALAKERELRQQSAGQVKAEVEGLATRGPVERGGGGVFRRRLTRRVIGGVAIATVAALVFVFLFRSSISRWTGGPALRPASAQALVQLGQHLREMKGSWPEGRLESKHLFAIPPELLIDPVTRQPFLFVGAGRTNLEPWEILVASPPRPDGREVLLQDGSVQRFTEARFWDVVTRNRPSALESPETNRVELAWPRLP